MTHVVPPSLQGALKPVTIVCGHYGSGKTNFCVNLALDCAAQGVRVSLIDLDIVNPYFRASEQRMLLEDAGVELVAPVFSEAGSNLDVPSLTGGIAPKLEAAGTCGSVVIVDLGGDDVGAGALGRFSHLLQGGGYAMLYVMNRHRNLMQDPAQAYENLREIEVATHLSASALVDNAHMKGMTDEQALLDPAGYAKELSRLSGLEVVAKTCPASLLQRDDGLRDALFASDAPFGLDTLYPIDIHVKNPWE